MVHYGWLLHRSHPPSLSTDDQAKRCDMRTNSHASTGATRAAEQGEGLTFNASFQGRPALTMCGRLKWLDGVSNEVIRLKWLMEYQTKLLQVFVRRRDDVLRPCHKQAKR